MSDKLLKNDNKVFLELFSKKKTADQVWDRVFADAQKGKIDQTMIACAALMCNMADQALMDFDKTKRTIKIGSKPMTDEEWERKYVDPYRQKL